MTPHPVLNKKDITSGSAQSEIAGNRGGRQLFLAPWAVQAHHKLGVQTASGHSPLHSAVCRGLWRLRLKEIQKYLLSSYLAAEVGRNINRVCTMLKHFISEQELKHFKGIFVHTFMHMLDKCRICLMHSTVTIAYIVASSSSLHTNLNT